jgi:cellulose synthase (UDP-forming)
VRRDGKAGNLNHALTVVDAAFVAVLDADQVPAPTFLEETVPLLLGDAAVAFVQTPQRYRNASGNRIAAAAKEQQAIFFGPIMEAKDGLGAVVCCGTNVVFRRQALRDVGGFAENSIAEDFVTSLRLYRRGWSARYLGRTLVSGLGPVDLDGYLVQQWRWARGCLGALLSRDLWGSGLTAGQRIQFASSAAYYLSGWAVFVYWLLPIAYLLTGRQPLAGHGNDEFAAVFLPYFGLALASIAAATRGRYGGRAILFSLALFPTMMSATLGLLRRHQMFRVTPKRRGGGALPLRLVPHLVLIAISATAVAMQASRPVTAEVVNNATFALVNAAVLAWPLVLAVAEARRPDHGAVPRGLGVGVNGEPRYVLRPSTIERPGLGPEVPAPLAWNR